MRMVLILLLILFSSNAWATNWCDSSNGCVACYLMEDDGNESNECANGSTPLTETGGDIPQDADAKFGDYSRDFEQGDTEVLYHADGNETDISGADQPMSIVFWVKPEAPSGGYLYYVSKFDFSGTNKQYAVRRGDSSVTNAFLSSDGTNYTSVNGSALSNGTWYHVAVTYNDVQFCLYIDGGSPSCSSHTSGIYDGPADFIVGGSYVNGGGFDQEMDGLVDDVGVFDTALDSTDINDIMDNGLVQSSGTSHRVPASMELRNVILRNVVIR